MDKHQAIMVAIHTHIKVNKMLMVLINKIYAENYDITARYGDDLEKVVNESVKALRISQMVINEHLSS